MSTASSNTVQARVGREKQRYDNNFRLVAGYCIALKVNFLDFNFSDFDTDFCLVV